MTTEVVRSRQVASAGYGRLGPCHAHYQVAPGVVAHCTLGFEHGGDHGQKHQVLVSPTIARPSAASLYLEPVEQGKTGQATGFLVERSGRVYLVTNRHVVFDDAERFFPTFLGITHNLPQLGTWVNRDEALYDPNGHPLWLEHPKLGSQVDVVALPLTNTVGIATYLHDPWNPGPAIATGVSQPLHIIGFPFGTQTNSKFAIWVRGFIASEPDVDFDDLPQMLIDSRTRPGQSGAPVIAYSGGGMTAMADGGSAVFSGPIERFVGVYAGRINDESDLGVVWKARVVCEIVDGGRRGSVVTP